MINVIPPGVPEWLPAVAIIVGVFAVILVLNNYQVRRRREALSAVALEIGFNYEGDNWKDPDSAPHLDTALFDRGHGGEVRNVMTGSRSGMLVSMFDYEFTTGGGKSSNTHKQTVASFTRAGIYLPEFALQPEGILRKVTNAFLHRDIHFDSHPEFSRRFQLRSPEPEKTRQLFAPALLTFLEGLDHGKKWRIEGVMETVLIYCMDKRMKPVDCRGFLEETSALASQFFSLSGVGKSAS